MNPVEIEEAVSKLASEPFDSAEFAYQFLAAFGNKSTTIQRLRTGATNAFDVAGGVARQAYSRGLRSICPRREKTINSPSWDVVGMSFNLCISDLLTLGFKPHFLLGHEITFRSSIMWTEAITSPYLKRGLSHSNSTFVNSKKHRKHFLRFPRPLSVSRLD